MFTGITRGLCNVSRVIHKYDMIDYAIVFHANLLPLLKIGSSVSINGVCQTIQRIDGSEVYFTAIDETLRVTTLNELRVGDQVSVEPSLRFGEEIGGHLLSGHVNGRVTVATIIHNDENLSLTFNCPPQWMKYIFSKGFIALDGSSLTVGTTHPQGQFSVHLIPETLRVTNFKYKQIGDHVNIELDTQTVTIVDTVERFLASKKV